MKRNMAKLDLYRRFTNSHAVSVLLSIAWIGFEIIVSSSFQEIDLGIMLLRISKVVLQHHRPSKGAVASLLDHPGSLDSSRIRPSCGLLLRLVPFTQSDEICLLRGD